MGKKIEKPRYNVISFRVTDEDRKLIAEHAACSSQRVGHLAHELVMEGIRAKRAANGGRDSE